MIVLDASAAFEFLLRTRAGEAISAQLSLVAEVHAPHLLDIELASSLRRCVALGIVTGERAGRALDDLRVLRVHRYGHVPLLARTWDFRYNFSAYDACYLALAEALDATLLTCDKAMASARLRHGQVELV
ncbi:MAG: type II toxin-antitoxin system VapC family toxin [Acidobacteriota bacterium]|nr:type II toxin-antitoxin system VapC family toxin [Acidobacteriota bacterium]MDP9115470.1 type II toxin-antitoxin system VapC family toxin [Acidobacteriota bacterium]